MQAERSYTWFPLSLLWFGAAMSVAEIHTGGLIASAGTLSGLWAIFLGHMVGVFLLALMAYIGFREGVPSLMCTRIAFGKRGSWLLSLANIMQLLGWTTVMIQLNSQAVGGITRTLWGIEITPIAIITLGCLIALWALWETQGKHTGNTIAVILLGLLALLVTYTLWNKAMGAGLQPVLDTLMGPSQDGIANVTTATPTEINTTSVPQKPIMSFAEAFELSLIMPLSWMPLVADYASRAKNSRTACLAPALGYLTGSLWMYGLGFAGALLTGEANPTPMLMAAGLGIAALSVLVLSTIATTFLDVYSIIATSRNIFPNLPQKKVGLAAVIIGTGAALIWDSSLYVHFLHAIGAVFAPLGAIMFADYYLLHNDERHKQVSIPSLISLATGIGGYVWFSHLATPFGPTLSCLLLTLIVHIALRKIWQIRGQKPARKIKEVT